MEENKIEHPIIKGGIGYEVVMDPAGWKVSFDSSLENDLVIMAAMTYILDNTIAGFEVQKKKATGKELQSIKVLLEKTVQARFTVHNMNRHFQQKYKPFKDQLAKKAEKDAKKVLNKEGESRIAELMSKDAKVIDFKRPSEDGQHP